jgi:cytoplasmic iron level regulating protein YaaA (DUF328/UPF0246 family)
VLVLLPPSEGKARPESGAPVDLAALAHADRLTPQRERLLDVLERLGTISPARARAALGLSEGQTEEVARNARLREAPAAPAAEVYTGVLFERLRLPELPAGARDRVLIASGLWGVVRADDRIPAYKLSIGAKLPRFRTGLAAWWKPALVKALPDEGLVLDLRSGAYAAAWRPRDARVVAVRAFAERAGTRTPVSHMVKATRGDVARIALEASPPPRTPEAVAALVAATGREVELGTGTLDVIERA